MAFRVSSIGWVGRSWRAIVPEWGFLRRKSNVARGTGIGSELKIREYNERMVNAYIVESYRRPSWDM